MYLVDDGSNKDMNVPYPNCMALAPVLTTLVAVKDNICYPANGPRAVTVPDGAIMVSKNITRDSSYYNEQVYDGTSINRSTVYVMGGNYPDLVYAYKIVNFPVLRLKIYCC